MGESPGLSTAPMVGGGHGSGSWRPSQPPTRTHTGTPRAPVIDLSSAAKLRAGRRVSGPQSSRGPRRPVSTPRPARGTSGVWGPGLEEFCRQR